jgi:RNA polymerase sigma-70 factor (ECF subfamily)
MAQVDPDVTSVTLLGQLRSLPPDPAAWQEFVRRYRSRIYSFCVAWALQPDDAEDVTQTVLLKLVEKLPQFHYDPSRSFRSWLRTVTQRILFDFRSDRPPDQASGDSAILRLLDKVEARNGLVRELEAELDQELLEVALRRVQPLVPAQQWDAFRLTALEGLSGADAAAQLGMRVATVYTAKSKVQKRVQQELRRLEGDTDPIKEAEAAEQPEDGP